MTTYETIPIQWNANYSVGISMLDQHHKHLATLINQLAESSNENSTSENVVNILSSLVSYARYHFKHEEEMMAANNYRDLESHRLEHQHFCEVIAETCYGATLGVIGAKELFSYLTRWWKNHILLEDMKYKPYMVVEPQTLGF